VRIESVREPALVSPPPTFRDKDVFHDTEGRVFVAHGFIQPSDRVISYLKYVPSPAGKWKRRESNYERVFSGGAESAGKGFQLTDSKYIVEDSHLGASLLEVPKGSISKYFSPELRLKEIIHEGPNDILEERTKALAEILHDTLRIPYDRLGVTGSIAWKGHNPEFSDINMNVYGKEMTTLLQNGYNKVVDENSNVRFRLPEEWNGTISRVLKRSPTLTKSELFSMFTRRKEFCIDDFYIGVMPVLLPEEVPIHHGSESYTTLISEPIHVKVNVIESDYSPFTPALFAVDSDSVSEIGGAKISRLMIYDGALKDLFQNGDRLEICGIPQRVMPESGSLLRPFHQIMVGTVVGAGKEFVRVIKHA
jgi:predicted nucleotidyltransferase